MNIAWKPSRWLAALISAAGLVAALAAAADDAPPLPDPAAGELLIASKAMRDPRFHHSVILMVRHNKNGAFGIAINKLLGERRIAELLSEAKNGGKDDTIDGTIPVFLGGPVQPQYGFVIHSGDYRRPETLAVGEGLAMTASRDVLRDIGRHKGPAKYLFALGYAGWGAGQLEGEIARRDWFVVPADPELVFDAERGALWEKAVARRTQEL